MKMLLCLLDSFPELCQLDHGSSLLLLFQDHFLLILPYLSNRSPSLIAYFAEIVGLTIRNYIKK